MSDDENVIFITSSNLEVDFSFDQDEDLLIQITDDSRTQAFYLNDDQARVLRDWLKRKLP